MYEEKKLHTHVYTSYSLEEANEAMVMMNEKKVFGKVLLCMNGLTATSAESP